MPTTNDRESRRSPKWRTTVVSSIRYALMSISISSGQPDTCASSQGGVAQEVFEVRPGLGGVVTCLVWIAEQVDVAGDLEEVVPDAIGVESMGAHFDSSRALVGRYDGAVTQFELPEVAFWCGDARRFPVDEAVVTIDDHHILGAGFAVSDHIPLRFLCHLLRQYVELAEQPFNIEGMSLK